MNNEYLSPCDLLSIRPTNFITDCGLHSSETFRNGDFAHGHTYWTMEGDAGEQDGSGYARGEGRLYEGLYLKKGRHVFTADVRSKGELFVENATNGQTVESLTFDTDEWTPRRIVIDAVADDTYYLGIKRPRRPNPQRRARPSGPGRIAHMRRKPRGFRRFGSRAFFGTVSPGLDYSRNERTLPAHHARAGKTDRVRKYPSSQPVVSPQTCATDPAKIRTLGTSTQTDYVPRTRRHGLSRPCGRKPTYKAVRPSVRWRESSPTRPAAARSSERPYC